MDKALLCNYEDMSLDLQYSGKIQVCRCLSNPPLGAHGMDGMDVNSLNYKQI